MTALTILLVIVAAASGCQSITGKSFGQHIDDTTITAAVKAKLVGDRAKNLVAVNVDTNQGVVYLHGNVGTAGDRAAAERLARQTSGVRDVVNNLRVEPRAAGGPGRTVVAASPATAPFVGRHAVTGQVLQVDPARGQLNLRTAEGDVQMHLPPATLQNVRVGDRVTVDLAVTPTR